jgi:hypothetical protein
LNEFCPNCGTERTASFRFCAKCGADLDQASVTVPSAAPNSAVREQIGATASGQPPKRSSILPAAAISAGLVLVAVVVALAWTTLSRGQAAPESSSPAAASTGPASDAGMVVCSAVQDLATAHDDHASPMATILGTTYSGGPYPLSEGDRATVDVHLQAIADVLLGHSAALQEVRSPQFPQLIADTRDAYAGYANGILVLKETVDNPPEIMIDFVTAITPGVQSINAGKQSLDSALDQLKTLDAAGTVICP